MRLANRNKVFPRVKWMRERRLFNHHELAAKPSLESALEELGSLLNHLVKQHKLDSTNPEEVQSFTELLQTAKCASFDAQSQISDLQKKHQEMQEMILFSETCFVFQEAMITQAFIDNPDLRNDRDIRN